MRLSCGVVPFRKTGNKWEVLLLRCFKNWDFPKGMMDTGEDPLSAAKREFSEETGISEIEIISSELFIETEPYSNGKIARYYPGMVALDAQVEIRPNPVTGILEHHEFRWFSLDDADAKLVPRLKKILAWARVKINQ